MDPTLEEAEALHHEALRIAQLRGDFGAALPYAVRALAATEAHFGADHVEVAAVLRTLAIIYLNLGQVGTALELSERALRINEAAYGPEHPEVQYSLQNVATVYQQMGDLERALPPLRRALDLAQKNFGRSSESVGATQMTVAAVYLSANDKEGFRQAVGMAQSALRIFEKVGKLQEPSLMGKALNLLAVAHHKRGSLDEARRFYSRALAFFDSTFGPDYQALEPLLENFAELERDRGHPTAAEKLEARRERLLDAQRGFARN
jgi:tetratricopeptide (TPR) repeat protein